MRVCVAEREREREISSLHFSCSERAKRSSNVASSLGGGNHKLEVFEKGLVMKGLFE